MLNVVIGSLSILYATYTLAHTSASAIGLMCRYASAAAGSRVAMRELVQLASFWRVWLSHSAQAGLITPYCVGVLP